MRSSSDHWDKIFETTPESQLGWYESKASRTYQVLEHVPEWTSATVLLPGGGTSVLADGLVEKGCKLILNDISSEALARLKTRIGDEREGVRWVCQDISRPLDPDVPPSDIWIDRAVLHFLLDETDIRAYFDNLKTNLRSGGFALFAEFSLSGARKCAGLPLHLYSVDELSARLGSGFDLVHEAEYTYINPAGDPRPYVYALYRRG